MPIFIRSTVPPMFARAAKTGTGNLLVSGRITLVVTLLILNY
ncbi:MAG: hypothetical protein OXC72_03130 [Roseovarius sp.]|nr:hypothetical protein [Roseovarius sp.]